MATPLYPLSFSSRPGEALWAEYLESLVEWQKFAIFLPGICQSDVDKIEASIKAETTGKLDRQKMALWTKWTSVYPSGSWDDVVAALKKVEKITLAKEIEEKLKKEEERSSTNFNDLQQPLPSAQQQRSTLYLLFAACSIGGLAACYYVLPKIGDLLGKQVARWRGKEAYVPLKKITRYYDYNTLRNDLKASPNDVLKDAMIAGVVYIAETESADEIRVGHETKINAAIKRELGPAGIHTKGYPLIDNSDPKGHNRELEDTDNHVLSAPFKLLDANRDHVIVRNIDRAHGFTSILEPKLIGNNPGYKYHMLLHGSVIAIIGDARFKNKTGGDIVFYPKEVGKHVQTVINQKSMFKLNKAVIVIGVVSLIITITVAGLSIWLCRKWQKNKRQKDKQQNVKQNTKQDTEQQQDIGQQDIERVIDQDLEENYPG